MDKKPYTLTLQWTACEMLACAIQDLYSDVQLIDGSPSGFTFQYDFLFKKPLNSEFIPQIEERLRALITENAPILESTMMRTNAIEFFKHHKQFVKADILAHSKSQFVDIVKMGSFHDTVSGPVAKNSKEIAAYKIISIKQEMRIVCGEELEVTRIQGMVATDKQQLKQLQKEYQSAQAKDFRVQGEQQQLLKEIAPGSWVWLPQGFKIKESLYHYWKKTLENQDFSQVSSPKLLPTSQFSKNMYSVLVDIDGEDSLLISSASEVHACLYGQLEERSRVLPVRWAEWGTVFHQVPSGQVVGILNEPVHIQDIFTIFCSPESLCDQLISSLQFFHQMSTIFGFEHHWYVCAQRQRNSPVREGWEAAAKTLVDALQASGINSYLEDAEPVRVGPRVEMRVRDVYQREWSCGYLEVNLGAPQYYELASRISRGGIQRPSMITGSLFGSVERFAALLMERLTGERLQQVLKDLH